MATERIQLDTAAFGAIVLFLRTLWGWTQVELGERCGTSDSQVSLWETGQVMPRAASVRKLDKALGVAESTLYDLQQVLLVYVRDHPVAFDSLLRTSKALRGPKEVREPRSRGERTGRSSSTAAGTISPATRPQSKNEPSCSSATPSSRASAAT